MKMPVKMVGFAALLMSLCVGSAQARNNAYFLPIQDALKANKSQPDAAIRLYYADQPHPDVQATLKQGQVANKKAQGATYKHYGESNPTTDKASVENDDKEGCKLAMQAALRHLQDQAYRMGGNAVINIESYYRKKTFRSADKFECHAGNSGSTVALRGDIVRLKE